MSGGVFVRIEQLEYLCEIAKRKSMNAASSKLFVSQQTLSTAIKNLEKELDTKLLERTYHGVFPTEIGQELIEISEQMLIQLDQLKLKIASQNNKQLQGDLRVAVEPGINTLIMPKVVVHFYKYYPKINLSVTALSRDEVKERVLNKEFDIGLITNPGYFDNPEIFLDKHMICKEVFEFKLFARVSKESILSNESSISLRTLLNYPIALNKNHSGRDLLNELKKYGDPIVLPANYPGISQQLVLENLAVSIAVKLNNYLPDYFNNFDGKIVNIPIKEPLAFHAAYLIHEDNADSTIIKSFLDMLIKIT